MEPLQSLLQGDKNAPKTISTISIHGPKKAEASEGKNIPKTETKKREKTNIKVDRNKITYQVGDFVLFDGVMCKITSLDTTSNICELHSFWVQETGPILTSKLSPIPLNTRTARWFGKVRVQDIMSPWDWTEDNITHPEFSGWLTVELDGTGDEDEPYVLTMHLSDEDTDPQVISLHKRRNSARGEKLADEDYVDTFLALDFRYVHELQQFCRVFRTEFEFADSY